MLRYFAVFFYQMQNKTQKQTQKFTFNLSSNKKQEKHNGAAALKEGGILIAVLRCEDMTETTCLFRKLSLLRFETDGDGCAGRFYRTFLCSLLHVLTGPSFYYYLGGGAGKLCQCGKNIGNSGCNP